MTEFIRSLLGLGALFALAWLLVYIAKAPRRRWRREVAAREPLDPQAFVKKFYPNGEVPADVVARLRPIYARQFGFDPDRLRPDDNPRIVFDRTDDVQLIRDIEAEFGVTFSSDDVAQLDGSLDSLLRWVARRLSASRSGP